MLIGSSAGGQVDYRDQVAAVAVQIVRFSDEFIDGHDEDGHDGRLRAVLE
jgi:hypothetical protein